MTQDIRDAATIIVVRDRDTAPTVLMGMRGHSAVFMPNKFVFPGGAVDATDIDVPLATQINPICRDRLQTGADGPPPKALVCAGIRELWEETGLILGQADENSGWNGFIPSAAEMRFVFRAITPVGRPRRFDARFFIVDAGAIDNDLDDFSRASDELSHLQWVPLGDVRKFDLPFITQVVLAEIKGLIQSDAPPASVPFFKNTDEDSLFERLTS